MSDYYSPDNLSQIVPYLQGFTPKWLLLGGPADGCEAQEAVKRWPGINVVGVEPNQAAVEWQLSHGWPSNAPLYHAALSSGVGRIGVNIPNNSLRSGRVVTKGEESEIVNSTTWDFLDRMHSPFQDAILWMDIETHEWEALQGAKRLLDRDAIWLVNVEMQGCVEEKNQAIDKMLRGYGFRIVGEWNWSVSCWDRVYAKRPL